MLGALPYWLHLLAAAAWIGPQLMMFIVVVPGLGVLDDRSRTRLMGAVTGRFGWMGAVALAILVLTGLDNIDRYAPGSMFDYKYGYILAIKLMLVAALIALTLVHSLLVGPRLLRLQAAVNEGAPVATELAGTRRSSVMISAGTLLLSLLVVYCAALLRGPFAFEGA